MQCLVSSGTYSGAHLILPHCKVQLEKATRIIRIAYPNYEDLFSCSISKRVSGGSREFTLLHSDVNPTLLVLWIVTVILKIALYSFKSSNRSSFYAMMLTLLAVNANYNIRWF